MNHLTVFAFTPHEAPPPGGYVGYINVARAEDGSLRVMIRNRGMARHGDNQAPFADDASIYVPQDELERFARAILEWPFQVPSTPPGMMVSALDDIAAERARQISAEGWTPEHDDEHNGSEMARAAACYALLADPLRSFPVDFTRGISHYYSRHEEGPQPVYKDVPKLWPWAAAWWKPKDRRRDLVRAAALIVAEIERLDRASARAALPMTEGA